MPHGLTTAPANLAPQWPSGYIEALREVGARDIQIVAVVKDVAFHAGVSTMSAGFNASLLRVGGGQRAQAAQGRQRR